MVAFAFFVPVVPVARVNCVNPGCGGPQYDSITDSELGVGWSAAFVSPDAQYGWIALLAVVMFCIAVGFTLLLILRMVNSSPSPPTTLVPENSHSDAMDISAVRAAMAGEPISGKKK